MLSLSNAEARRFLTTYHFTPTDLPGVFARLGTVQYDPLNPVGRNPDLVLQARVLGYRVDDWQEAAYQDRLIYDSWDKQACLVPTADWPQRALIREKYRPYHDREILDHDPEAVAAVLAAIDTRGPLSSLEFEDRSKAGPQGSWAGQTRIKRILRSLWVCGQLVTHHRVAGRHYYDRPERVIPEQHFAQPPVRDESAYRRWIVLQRHRAAGLLRPAADVAIWSVCGDRAERTPALEYLVETGALTPVHVGTPGKLYHVPTDALPLLDAPLPAPRLIFVAPLDSILWDRSAVRQIFDFDYIWEVYKPLEQRKWGYYVLPVFYGDRFVGRIDCRLEGSTLTVARWWWEPDVMPTAELLDALREATARFLCYLRADGARVSEDVPPEVGVAMLSA